MVINTQGQAATLALAGVSACMTHGSASDLPLIACRLACLAPIHRSVSDGERQQCKVGVLLVREEFP
jgi:hypothetical protein